MYSEKRTTTFYTRLSSDEIRKRLLERTYRPTLKDQIAAHLSPSLRKPYWSGYVDEAGFLLYSPVGRNWLEMLGAVRAADSGSVIAVRTRRPDVSQIGCFVGVLLAIAFLFLLTDGTRNGWRITVAAVILVILCIHFAYWLIGRRFRFALWRMKRMLEAESGGIKQKLMRHNWGEVERRYPDSPWINRPPETLFSERLHEFQEMAFEKERKLWGAIPNTDIERLNLYEEIAYDGTVGGHAYFVEALLLARENSQIHLQLSIEFYAAAKRKTVTRELTIGNSENS